MVLWLSLLTLWVVWGSTYLAIRIVVHTAPPLLSAGLRFLAAGLILAGILLVWKGWRVFAVSRAELLGAAGVSTLTLSVAFALLFLGETRVPSGVASLLIASVPLWVVLVQLVARERVRWRTAVAVFVGLAGVAALVLPGRGAAAAPVLWLLIVVAAAVSEAVGSFLAQRVRLPGDTMVSATLQMLIAGVTTVAVGLAVGERLDIGTISADSMLAFLYLVGPGSVVAYSAYVWLLRHTTVSTATTYAYVNPVVAVALGWLVLDETVTLPMLAAAAAIVVSVAMVVRAEHRVTDRRARAAETG